MPAKFIIHAVGPVWYGGDKNEEALLASCYRECLKLAVVNGIKSIAFPAISCGAYRFPIDKACKIAVSEVVKFLEKNKVEMKVVFVCFDEKFERVFNKVIKTYS